MTDGTPAEDPGTTANTTQGRKSFWITRTIAILILLAASAILIGGLNPSSCDKSIESSTQSGTPPTVSTSTTVKRETCHSELSLIQIAPLLAVALILVAGEFSEISIPGVMALKRHIEHQGEIIEQQGERQKDLENAITELRISTSQSQIINFGNDQYANPQVVEKNSSNLEGTNQEGAEAEADNQKYQQALAKLQMEVLAKYEEISPYIYVGHRDLFRGDRWTLSPRLRASLSDKIGPISPLRAQMLREWTLQHSEEISTVGAVRNSIAHPPAAVTLEDLESTLRIIKRLKASIKTFDLPELQESEPLE